MVVGVCVSVCVRVCVCKLNMSPLQIKNQVITPLDKVSDLGVIIDSKLTMEADTANVVRSCLPTSPTTEYPAFVDN